MRKDAVKRHCMVVHHPYPRAEPRVEREAQALIHRGYEVDVVCLQHFPDEPAFEVVDGVNVYRLSLRRAIRRGVSGQLLEYLAFFTLAFFKVSALHSKRKYQVVEAHNLPNFLVFCGLWAKLTGARVILNIHDVMPEFFAVRMKRPLNNWKVRPALWEEKLSCLFADHVFIATHRWREALIRRGVPAKKISVIMNLADGRIFKQPVPPRTHPTSGFRIIYHGSITSRYGVDMAIKAVDKLRDRVPGIHLTLAGRGEYRDEAVELVDQLQLQEHVSFLDTLPFPELPDLITRSDIGVTAYRVDGFTEGCLPTKLLEYTMMGIPAVTSRTDVITDYFDDSQVEFCEPGNLDDLANHIYLLYSNAERFNELARNTARFNEKYNWANMSAEYEGIISELHHNHHGPNGKA